jgi:hypothetical protein
MGEAGLLSVVCGSLCHQLLCLLACWRHRSSLLLLLLLLQQRIILCCRASPRPRVYHRPCSPGATVCAGAATLHCDESAVV